MEKEIFELIRSLGNFDGLYYEMFLKRPISLEKGKDIIRVIVSDGDVIAHVLDMNDVTEFYYFRTYHHWFISCDRSNMFRHF